MSENVRERILSFTHIQNVFAIIDITLVLMGGGDSVSDALFSTLLTSNISLLTTCFASLAGQVQPSELTEKNIYLFYHDFGLKPFPASILPTLWFPNIR